MGRRRRRPLESHQAIHTRVQVKELGPRREGQNGRGDRQNKRVLHALRPKTRGTAWRREEIKSLAPKSGRSVGNREKHIKKRAGLQKRRKNQYDHHQEIQGVASLGRNRWKKFVEGRGPLEGYLYRVKRLRKRSKYSNEGKGNSSMARGPSGK